jgi:hypothetical protein
MPETSSEPTKINNRDFKINYTGRGGSRLNGFKHNCGVWLAGDAPCLCSTGAVDGAIMDAANRSYGRPLA